MILDHKARWIFSPLDAVTGHPVAAEYAIQWEAPLHHDGAALVHCIMNAHQLSAARKDKRLIVLDSIHSAKTIPGQVAYHHRAHGLHDAMTLHDALVCMAKHHPSFEPSE